MVLFAMPTVVTSFVWLLKNEPKEKEPEGNTEREATPERTLTEEVNIYILQTELQKT